MNLFQKYVLHMLTRDSIINGFMNRPKTTREVAEFGNIISFHSSGIESCLNTRGTKVGINIKH